MTRHGHFRIAAALISAVGIFNSAASATWVKEYDSQEDENPIGATYDHLSPWGETYGYALARGT